MEAAMETGAKVTLDIVDLTEKGVMPLIVEL